MTLVRTLIALSLLSALGAQAQEVTRFAEGTGAPSRTRSEVIAELLSAARNGQLMRGNEGPDSAAPVAHARRSREDVRAEAIAAQRIGAREALQQRWLVGM